MTFQEIRDQDQKYIIHTYGRVDAALVKGRNATAWDVEGKEYIDFTSGIGVNSLGYCDPDRRSVEAGGGDTAPMQLLLLAPEHGACGGTLYGGGHGPGFLLQLWGRGQ